eukprot:6181348-Pleurochrysis_carterae.AAC.1
MLSSQARVGLTLRSADLARNVSILTPWLWCVDCLTCEWPSGMGQCASWDGGAEGKRWRLLTACNLETSTSANRRGSTVESSFVGRACTVLNGSVPVGFRDLRPTLFGDGTRSAQYCVNQPNATDPDRRRTLAAEAHD